MQEKIINLLSLCMQAQDKGFNIAFDNSFGYTHVWHHTSDDGQKVIKSILIYHNNNDCYEKIAEAEAYLKELIA